MKLLVFICVLVGVDRIQAGSDRGAEAEAELYENQNELLKEIKRNFMDEIKYVREIKSFMNQTCYEDNRYLEYEIHQIYKQIHKYSDSLDSAPNNSLCFATLKVAEIDLLRHANDIQNNLNNFFKETYKHLSIEMKSFKKSKKDALKIISGDDLSDEQIESIKLSDLISERKIPKEKTKWKKFIYETMFFFKNSVKFLQQFVVDYLDMVTKKNINFLQDLKKHHTVYFNTNCRNGKDFPQKKSKEIQYENKTLLEDRIRKMVWKDIQVISKLNDSNVATFDDSKQFIDFRLKLIVERTGFWFSQADLKDINQCTAALQGVTTFIIGKNISVYKNFISQCFDEFLNATQNMAMKLTQYVATPLSFAKEKQMPVRMAEWNESLYSTEYKMSRENRLSFLRSELKYRTCINNIIEFHVVQSSEEIEKLAVANCVDRKLYANSTLSDFIKSQSIY